MREVGTIKRIERSADDFERDQYWGKVVRIRGGEFPFGPLSVNGRSLLAHESIITFDLECSKGTGIPQAASIRLLAEEWEVHTLVYALLQDTRTIAECALWRIEQLHSSGILSHDTIGASLAGQLRMPIGTLLQLLPELDEGSFLRTCFYRHVGKLWRTAAKPFLSDLPLDQHLHACLTKCNMLDDAGRTEFAATLDQQLLMKYAAAPLREVLPLEAHIALFRRNPTLAFLAEEIAARIVNSPQTDTRRSQDRHFWDIARPYIRYGNRLFSLAPKAVRTTALEETFSDLCGTVRHCLTPPDIVIEWPSDRFYSNGCITSQDEALASKWLKNEHLHDDSGFHLARMLSARCAEKVAREFYTSLGHSVEDIAITQLSGKSALWKSADLRLDESQLIDVKNARNSRHSKTSGPPLLK
jgi:hypothetical protein